MLTAEVLLKIAADAEAEYQRLRVLFPPGTINDERNEAHDRAEKAMICAEWMEKTGLVSAHFVGPFSDAPASLASAGRGDEVRVKAGARIFSTAPDWPREGKLSTRSQRIKIHSVDHGYIDRNSSGLASDAEMVRVKNPKIQWVGSGGYWRWVDMNDVELI